jgi:NADPH-dependent 2,4-dienoyl-CoA reductase/sulfur reductase-like enzyme/nitrite reductase/ring-hydroxylating ferredoxin subunit
MSDKKPDTRPDLTTGIAANDLADGGMLLGRVGKEDVLLARAGKDVFAVGAHCTHYHGPLAEGLLVGDTVRCPWHHACFSLRTGEAERAPALDPIACWKVDRQGDRLFVREKLPEQQRPTAARTGRTPASVIIVGGGAAGLAAADMLRREGYDGSITMISADEAAPVDRPNLSKDYLAGNAKEDWIPLRGPEFYEENRIELLLKRRVASIDPAERTVQMEDQSKRTYGALLLATGADPVRLPIPGADGPNVHYLRSFADSQAIIAKTANAKHVVVVGASFIGLEVAASLRARDIKVDVVAPGAAPLEHVMGAEVGRFVQRLHESKGVFFRMGQSVERVDNRKVTLSDGSTLDADFVVFGVGVRPATALAEQAGLKLDHGVAVNEYLETSASGIFAAGDIARWPDPHTGERIRVEHWVVAERQGQTAARNILGRREPFDMVPFFWSQHYDIPINYVGHAEKWDSVQIDGNLDEHDCAVTYFHRGRRVAVATVFRDRVSLEAELAMEREAMARPAIDRAR